MLHGQPRSSDRTLQTHPVKAACTRATRSNGTVVPTDSGTTATKASPPESEHSLRLILRSGLCMLFYYCHLNCTEYRHFHCGGKEPTGVFSFLLDPRPSYRSSIPPGLQQKTTVGPLMTIPSCGYSAPFWFLDSPLDTSSALMFVFILVFSSLEKISNCGFSDTPRGTSPYPPPPSHRHCQPLLLSYSYLATELLNPTKAQNSFLP